MAGLARGSVVAVIGSGAMGSGIAQVAAASGHEVRLTKPGATYGEDRYRVSPLLRRKLAANPTGARFHA